MATPQKITKKPRRANTQMTHIQVQNYKIHVSYAT